MTDSKPFFSIVMPTCNRAHLLQYAIKSVLQQDFEDFEIVLSDNCSEDKTKEVVEGFADRRIHYYKTEKSLPIDESWNFAISKAKGEFITFLSDDDAYLGFRLKKAFEVISHTETKLLVHKYAGYYPKGNGFQGNRTPKLVNNSLTIPWFSGEFVEVKAAETIQNVYAKIEHYFTHQLPAPVYFADMPHVSDALYHKSLIENVHRKVSKLIKSRQGDIYLGVNILNEIDTYIYLDLPLTIFSTYPEQTTSQSILNGLQNNLAKSDAETKFRRSPLKFWTATNSLADILIEALEDNKSLADKNELNWDNYFSKCLFDLEEMEKAGIQVVEFRKQFDETIKKYIANGLVTLVSSQVIKHQSFNLKRQIWKKLQNFPIVKIARMRFEPTLNACYWQKLLVNPQRTHLSSIFDCVTLLNEKFIEETKSFWMAKKIFPNKIAKLI